MKWMKFLQSITGFKSYSKNKGNCSKKCRQDSIKKWVMKVARSSQTVDQAFTSLKLMELAGMTNTEEYRLWSEFKTLTEQ